MPTTAPGDETRVDPPSGGGSQGKNRGRVAWAFSGERPASTTRRSSSSWLIFTAWARCMVPLTSSAPLPRHNVAERSIFLALPEVSENDDTGNRCIGAPQGGERVSLHRHHHEQYAEVRYAKDHHVFDLRDQEGTTGGYDVEHGDESIVGGRIDVHDAVASDVNLQGIGGQGPKDIESRQPANHREGQHASTALPVDLK